MYFSDFLYITQSLKKIISHTACFCNLVSILSILWTPFYVDKYCFVSFLVVKDYSMHMHVA